MGSGELGAEPHPTELGDRGMPSALLIDEVLSLEDVAPISAAIFWEASCLRRFMRRSSSLKLFDISPSARGVSLNTDGYEVARFIENNDGKHISNYLYKEGHYFYCKGKHGTKGRPHAIGW